MELTFYHVDAFASKAFEGNPAAVFILEEWLEEKTMQAIAAEFNLSETVFTVKEGKHYHIRWFTPAAEVPLCGHATIATSHVLQVHLGASSSVLSFMSQSGELFTEYKNGVHTLDFPANDTSPVEAPDNLQSILGCSFEDVVTSKNKLFVRLQSEQEVAEISPDFFKLAKLEYRAVCVNALAESPELDFVCRFFAPVIGINEDPVTGSAYTSLAPYYKNLTGKTRMNARQLSARGGDVGIELVNDRVLISGNAHTVMKGVFYLDTL